MPFFTFDHFWQGLLSLGLALLGWHQLARRDGEAGMKKSIDEAAADAEDARRALEQHKLFAAETYARKADVDRTIEAAEKRLREQIRDQGQRQLEVLEEIRDRLPARH